MPIIPIEQLSVCLPYYEYISAGFPSPADDFSEKELSLDQYLIKNPAATFFVRVQGDSMTGAGMGCNTVCFAAAGAKPSFKMRQEHKSPSYTTRWEDLLNI